MDSRVAVHRQTGLQYTGRQCRSSYGQAVPLYVPTGDAGVNQQAVPHHRTNTDSAASPYGQAVLLLYRQQAASLHRQAVPLPAPTGSAARDGQAVPRVTDQAVLRMSAGIAAHGGQAVQLYTGRYLLLYTRKNTLFLYHLGYTSFLLYHPG